MSSDASFLPPHGAMADAIRHHPWAATPLGPIDQWPDTLKTTLALVLASGFPQAIVWGSERITLYNDAFAPVLGDKAAPLGRPFDEIWAEAWAEIGPIAERAYAGEPTYIEDFPLAVEGGGALEQRYFTFCYSPIRDETGRILGMLDTVVETTATVTSGRRLAFLDELSLTIARAADATEIMATTTRMVAAHLSLSNCAYADMDADEDGFTIRGDWAAPGSPHITGHYKLADFGALAVQELGAARPLVVNDNRVELQPHEAATFQAIGITATICMPLVRDGRLVALMAIHDRAARRWTRYELSLIRDVTERSWAHIERVRADAAAREAARALQDLNASLEQAVEERTARLMETEAALRQAQKMEAIGQLTGGIAHDFNNLLAGISGSLEIIERRMAQGRSDGVQRFLSGAQTSAQRAAALTQRLLAFSRRQTLDPKPTDVNRLVVGLEELIRRTVGPAIVVEVAGAAGLWPVRVDAAQLESALLNLAINARDAMPDGGRLTIETSNHHLDRRMAQARDMVPGHYVSISVTDNGTGIPEDVVDRIFDPFFTTKPIGQGTGLGLSMIHGFVRQSGGQVRVHTVPGEGTTMRLFLPRYTGDAPAPEPEQEAAIEAVGSGQTVLVIDDEPTVRMLIAEVLHDAGYVALEAADGPSGLRILESEARIDLLVTDVGLPGGMNGRQVADAARVTRPELKVLFVTGFAENAAVGNGQLPAGMQVITKPFAMGELAARITELIDAA